MCNDLWIQLTKLTLRQTTAPPCSGATLYNNLTLRGKVWKHSSQLDNSILQEFNSDQRLKSTHMHTRSLKSTLVRWAEKAGPNYLSAKKHNDVDYIDYG